MTDQLQLPGDKPTDLQWMRRVIEERHLKDVTDVCLQKFWDLAGGDRQMAVEAICSIHGGHSYPELRSLIEVRRRGVSETSKP